MGTTLTALNSDTGVSLVMFVGIEGYPSMVTDADSSAAAVQTVASDAGFTGAFGGLEVEWNLDQRLHPWEPFNASSSSVTIKLHNADSAQGAEILSAAMFTREGMTSSPLFSDVDPGDTVVEVKRSSAFAGTGNIYIGCETIAYTGNDNGTAPGTFSTLTRGKYTPFKHSGGGGFRRTHRKTPTVPGVPAPDVEAGTSAIVTDAPLDWRGRWVGVWLVRKVGSTYDSIAQSHLAFAGRISNIIDSPDGRTIIHVDEVRQVIRDAVILREQWRAKIKDGVTLVAGTRFTWSDVRLLSGGANTVLISDPLTVVAAGAASVNEIDAGRWDGADLASRINDWAASELAAARCLFRHVFKYNDTDPGGSTRSSLFFSDDTSVASGARSANLNISNDDVCAFLGVGDTHTLRASSVVTYYGTGYSQNPPQRAMFNLTVGTTSLPIEAVQGSFANQAALMDQGPTFLTSPVGFVKIGDVYLPCEAPSVAAGVGTILVGEPVNKRIGADLAERWWSLPADDGGAIEVVQVLVLESSFAGLVLALLSSTGGGLNWPAYDVLPEHCSAAIPYDLLGSGLESEINAANGGLDVMTVIVDKPTRFPDLFDASFTLRLIQFVWRQGRLALRGYATPTSSATLTIAADSRSSPVGTEDTMLAATTESDAIMRNVVKIRHNADATGKDFRDTITITDPGSAANFGARILTLNARNAIRGTGEAGEDVDALVSDFIAGLIFLGRPQMTIRVPLDHNMIEQATPGEVCLFTDGFARDPATGLRGITAKPALIIAQNASWGGLEEPARCEVTLMIFPRLSLAAYSPCAQVDDTAANAGYNAGTKVLTCYAHEHSEAAAVADATLFLAGHKIRVIEIDPAVAAAPTTWDDEVASQSGNTITLVTGLAGWDNTKKYRVISDTYGDAVTVQRTKVYQADDADGQVADARAPYGMMWTTTGQATNATSSAATELPERPPTAAYGDGVALDTGHARAVARGVNNLVSYKTAPQIPQPLGSAEVMGYAGAGTWRLVWAEQVYIGIGTGTASLARSLYVAPTIRANSGVDRTVRVTLSKRPPRAANPASLSRDDVTRVAPYVTSTFTTSSATFVTPTAVKLDTRHLQLAPNHGIGGGMGWLYVELATEAQFRGFGVKYVGPVVAP